MYSARSKSSIISSSSSKKSRYENIAPRYLDIGSNHKEKYKRQPLTAEQRQRLQQRLEKEKNAKRIVKSSSKNLKDSSRSSKIHGYSLPPRAPISTSTRIEPSLSLKKNKANHFLTTESIFFNGNHYIEKPYWSLPSYGPGPSFSLCLWTVLTSDPNLKNEKSRYRKTGVDSYK